MISLARQVSIQIVSMIIAIPIFIFAQNPKSCKIDTTLYYQNVLPAYYQLRGEEKLPVSISLKQFCPIPRNQGEYGTCVAWTSAYYARTIMLAQAFHWNRQEINQKAGSPFFVYEHIKSYEDKNCQEGTGLIIALEALKQYGTLPFEEFSQQKCGQKILSEHYPKAELYKISEYRRLFLANHKEKILPVKKALWQKSPVVIGLFCYFKSFLQAKDSLWEPSEQEINSLDYSENGHALCIIGYNDTLAAFEAVNSWGEKWGNKGFIWIPYKIFEKVCFEAYQMYDSYSHPSQIMAEIRLKLAIGEEIPVLLKEGFYESKILFQSGTLLKVVVSTQEPVFLYAFSIDSEKINLLFPFLPTHSAIVYPVGAISIPSEHHYIQLTDHSLYDYICILLSKEKLHWSSFIEQFKNLQEGKVYDRIHKVLASKLVPLQEIRYNNSNSKIKLEAIMQKGSVVPVIIAIPKK